MLNIFELKKSFVSPDGERVEILHVPAFTLGVGELLALRGESGSGKTTFLNLIAGILAADTGRVTIEGVEMTALSEPGLDRLRAEKLGYIFQAFNLLQGTRFWKTWCWGCHLGRAGRTVPTHARCSSGWGSGTGWIIFRDSSRAGSNNGWRSRARW